MIGSMVGINNTETSQQTNSERRWSRFRGDILPMTVLSEELYIMLSSPPTSELKKQTLAS